MAEAAKTEKPTKPATLLVEWTADCIKHIAEKLYLNTGINEVKVSEWEKYRWYIADIVVPEGARISDADRKDGRIIEISAEVVVDPKDSQKCSVTVAASLKDLDIPEAIKVVEDCVSLTTLSAWKARETRDSVAVAINGQIAKIEKEA